ncbi:MAG: glutamine synthetase family protein [Gaiellales bacterium]
MGETAVEIIEGWRARGVRWVRFEIPDMHGTSRSKMVPVEHAAGFAERGLNMYGGAGVLDTASSVVPGTLYNEETGYADMTLVPDPATGGLVPWCEVPTARFVCDAYGVDGSRLEALPRSVFGRVLERCRSHGFEPLIGFEPEFYLLDGESMGRLFDGLHIFNTVRNTYVPFLQTLVDTVREYGIDAITHNCEYSGSQYEIPFAPGLGMVGPDQCFSFKNAAKELAHLHGYVATFMGKPFSGLAGSGNHTHVSLLDGDGRNVFGDDSAEQGISDLCRAFVAGNLKYALAVYTLLVPTVNCLKRRRPHTFSPTNVSWGLEDRSALVRIKGGSQASRHVEHRAPSAAGNPYLLGAAVLGAGLLGIEEGLSLGPPAPAPAEEDPTITQLPVDMREALRELESCGPIRELLGEEFLVAYTTMRRYELQRFEDHVGDWEFTEYAELY